MAPDGDIPRFGGPAAALPLVAGLAVVAGRLLTLQSTVAASLARGGGGGGDAALPLRFAPSVGRMHYAAACPLLFLAAVATVTMVRMSVLADCLRSITNAERRARSRC